MGKAEVVVQDTETFRAMTERIQQTEVELQNLKRKVLQNDFKVGIEQIEAGAYSDYDNRSLPSLLNKIKTRDQKRLG